MIMALTAIAACDSHPGPDSISSHHPSAADISSCTSACHNAQSTVSPDPLVTNGTGADGKHVKHVTDRGLSCDRCHLDYTSRNTHFNGTLDTGNPAALLVYFDSVNPAGSWVGDAGPRTGGCTSLACHDVPLDWYGPDGSWSLPTCDTCHSAPVGSRRQVFGAAGDFAGNAAVASRHVTGAAEPTSDQCKVCHDVITTHMGGTVSLKNADAPANILYNPAVPSSIEPFCLSCHDADGALNTAIAGGSALSPFNDGSSLGSPPYPYAARIAASWAKFYGHGTNGNHSAGDRLTCLGSGQPGTGCHGNSGQINAHGSATQVLAAQPFKYDTGGTYIESDYYLCFNCHASYFGVTKEDIFGVQQGGILDYGYGPPGGRGLPPGFNPPYVADQFGNPKGVTTLFADHNDPAYLDDPTVFPNNDYNFWGTKNANLHWFHINITISNFRSTGVATGIHCVNCHDVHGSTIPYGAVYDEIGYYHDILDGGSNRLGKMTDAAYNSPLLSDHPTYCTFFNCHPAQGPSKAWYYPITE